MSLIVAIVLRLFVKGNSGITNILIASFATGFIFAYKYEQRMPQKIKLGISFSTSFILMAITFITLHFLVFKNAYAELFNFNLTTSFLLITISIFVFVGCYFMLDVGSRANIYRLKRVLNRKDYK